MAHNIICARNPTTGLTHTLECSGSNELKVVLDAEAQTSLNNIEIAVVNADADLDTINTTLTSKLDSVITNTANIKLSTDSVNLNVDTLESLIASTNDKSDHLSSNLDTLHSDLGLLEISNQSIKDNGIRSWGAVNTLEGNLVVSANSTHSGSSSYPTIPTKDFLVKVKCHGAITTWEATLQGSLDNSTWEDTTTQSQVINPSGRLPLFPQYQQVSTLIRPQFPYVRFIIKNDNGADRGFEIKIVQIN